MTLVNWFVKLGETSTNPAYALRQILDKTCGPAGGDKQNHRRARAEQGVLQVSYHLQHLSGEPVWGARLRGTHSGKVRLGRPCWEWASVKDQVWGRSSQGGHSYQQVPILPGAGTPYWARLRELRWEWYTQSSVVCRLPVAHGLLRASN